MNFNPFKKEVVSVDAVVDESTGMGTENDKLEHMIPTTTEGRTAREIIGWYKSLGVLQNIINDPVNEICRAGWEYECDETVEGLIEEKLNSWSIESDGSTRRGIVDMVRQLGIYSRLFDDGGLIFIGTIENKPMTAETLKEPLIMSNLKEVDFFTLLNSDDFDIYRDYSSNRLSKDYNKIKYFRVGAVDIHPSRCIHLQNDFVDRFGVSVTGKVLATARAIHTVGWSVESIMQTLSYWIFKSPAFKSSKAKKVVQLLRKLKLMASSQSMVAIADDETFSKEVASLNIADGTNFLWEKAAAESGIPQNRIKGQGKGAIAAADADERAYFDGVDRKRQTDYRFVINKFVELAKWTCGLKNPESIIVKVKFNSFYQQTDKELAEIEEIRSRSDKNDIDAGIITGDEARSLRDRYKDLVLPDVPDVGEPSPEAYR